MQKKYLANRPTASLSYPTSHVRSLRYQEVVECYTHIIIIIFRARMSHVVVSRSYIDELLFPRNF